MKIPAAGWPPRIEAGAQSSSASWSQPSLALNFSTCALLLCALTGLRLAALQFSAVDLYFDESQYWVWSREPAFGYFSKPPLLAWVIGLTEAVCGSGESCLRSAAPMFHLGTALVVFRIAERLFGSEAAFFSAMTYALAPGIIFSTRIISTDVPLLFFWALALLAFVELRRGSGFPWAATLGVCLGLGLLAKYAAIYFLIGVAVAAMIDRHSRKLLYKPQIWIALAIAAAMVTPNLIWNIENQFSTLRHTGDNVRGSGFQLNPIRALEFLSAQFAVFGPVSFAAIAGAAFLGPRVNTESDRLLLAFVLPVLLLVTFVALSSRAHPNWAATAYVAGSIVAAVWLIRIGAKRWMLAGMAFGVVVQAALIVTDAFAYRVQIPGVAKTDPYAPTLGWRELGSKTGQLAFGLDTTAIVSEHRREIASLAYYLRSEPVQVFAWPAGPVARNHFELTRPLPAMPTGSILLISPCPEPGRLGAQFAFVASAGKIESATGPNSSRVHYVFLLSDPRGPIRPLSGCSH